MTLPANTLESTTDHFRPPRSRPTLDRRSFSRGSSMIMFRSSSSQRIQSIRGLFREDSVVWGNDSCAQIKLNFSLEVRNEREEAISTLLKEVKYAIDEQTKRKETMERQMSVAFKLAKARYLSGSHIGAVLSMRKAHRNKSMKAYISAARYQLTALQKDVETALQDPNYDLDVKEKEKVMKEILSELTIVKFEMPDDADLLCQLERSILLEARNGECRARAA